MSPDRSVVQPTLAGDLRAMASPQSVVRDVNLLPRLRELREFYLTQLRQQVMPFWEVRVLDRPHDGLLHYFDRQGNVESTDRSTWAQTRMAYLFSLLWLELGDESNWREAAESARRFIVEHAHLGGGRFCYLCDRTGKVIDARRSAYSDAFAVMGLCTHALATGNDEDHGLIEQAATQLLRNLSDPDFAEYHHFDLDARYAWHGPAMVALGVAPLVRAVLDDELAGRLADWAMLRVLRQFLNDDLQMLLEVTDRDGRPLDTDQGRITNPGHALESSWFCMEEALYQRDGKALQRALLACRWACEKGWDEQYGGLFAFVDTHGDRPPGDDVVSFGDRWDDKLWWVQCESLYALALTACCSDDRFYWKRFEQLHDFTFRYLPDTEYGEWYMSVDRQGKPQKTAKGTVFRSAFHVPRALLKLHRLFAMVVDGLEANMDKDQADGSG